MNNGDFIRWRDWRDWRKNRKFGNFAILVVPNSLKSGLPPALKSFGMKSAKQA